MFGRRAAGDREFEQVRDRFGDIGGDEVWGVVRGGGCASLARVDPDGARTCGSAALDVGGAVADALSRKNGLGLRHSQGPVCSGWWRQR